MSKIKIILIFFLTILLTISLSWAQQKKQSKDFVTDRAELEKPTSAFDRGVGFLNAGKLTIGGIDNWGILSRWSSQGIRHGYWGEIRWFIPFVAISPQSWATNILMENGNVVDRSQYYNCVESATHRFGVGAPGTGYPDWEAQDEGKTQLMGDELWSDYRLIATSTRVNSWPQGYFDKNPDSPTYKQFINRPEERHWPGYWALDPNTGEVARDTVSVDGFDVSNPPGPWMYSWSSPDKIVAGRFTSDKEIFYIMNDKYNGIRLGDETDVGYPIGFDMEVTGYSYAASAYEDIVFFNYNLIYRDDVTDPNRQYYTGTIDSVYFGFIIDPDLPGADPTGNQTSPWAEDDYCIADTVRNLFVMFDKDGYEREEVSPYSEGEVSTYGVAFLKTPKDVGLTGFHFFDQDAGFDAEPCGPKLEKLIYSLASGRKDLLTPQDQQKYFHGEDPHFDDLTLLQEFQEQYVGESPDVWFLMTSGPFSVSPGDTIPLHFCVLGGDDDPGALDADGFATNPYEVRFADILNNFDRAMQLYNNSFQGTGPPATPTLNAVGTKVLDENDLPVVYTEDGKVTLYWNDIAEKTVDILTKQYDLEGYRIYKAYFDRGLDYIDWGQEVYGISSTGGVGDLLTYEPVFQCDKINEYEGMDPFKEWFYIGNNSGLVHSWTDTDVTNGVRYRYCITAYDHYYTEYEFSSNETPRGTSAKDICVIDVIPGVRPTGYIPARIDPIFQRLSGAGNGVINLEILDDNEILEHTYKLSFANTGNVLQYSVYDSTTRKYLVVNSSNIANESSGEEPEAFPFFNGVGLKIINFDQVDILEEETRWTSVVGSDTSDYRIQVIGSSKANSADYEIRFTADGDTNAIGTKILPFQVWNIAETPPKQIDLAVVPTSGEYKSGEQIRMWEYLTPDAVQRTFTWIFLIEWDPDTVIVGNDTTLVTAYGEAGKAPAVGDIFTITTKKPFINDVFLFNTYPPTSATITEDSLDNIKVVPNPYVVSSRTELYTGDSQWDLHEVRFTHLPPKCTINIYTLTGDHIRKIEHNSITYGEARWDLLSKENLDVSYGIYIYVVKTPNGKTKVGKLAVVK